VGGGWVNADTNLESVILTSTDGANWVQRWFEKGIKLSAIDYGNGKFVAVGARASVTLPLWTAAVLTSTDGTNWVEHDLKSRDLLLDIAYGNGVFLAVSEGYPANILLSKDGLNWAQQTSSAEARGVRFVDGQFVAVGFHYDPSMIFRDDPSLLLTSTDGVKWFRRPIGTRDTLRSVAYGDGRVVVVGENALIAESGAIINLAIAGSPGPLALSLSGPAGLGYTVQMSTDLVSWRNLTNFTSVQPDNFIYDLQLATSGRLFYRVFSH
jgi:hypothetical protein